jgi:hypothetical protein
METRAGGPVDLWKPCAGEPEDLWKPVQEDQ